VVAPEVPRGGAIRQAVFDHQADGQGDDPLGVVAAGGRQVRQVGAEVKATGLATVLRVSDVKVAGPVPVRAAEVVEDAAAHAVAIAAPTAVRAATPTVAPRAASDQRPGQVLNTGDARGAVRDILPWWHSSLSSTSVNGWRKQSEIDENLQGEPDFLATVSAILRF